MSIIRLYRRVIGKFIRIRIKKSINGKGNRIFFDRSLTGGTLRIIISGNNNEIVVGPNCWFQGVNTFFIVGDNNRIYIGQGVTFDGKVDFVLGEGTSVKIGDDCMFANNVLFRTSDQHAIYNADNERINRGGGILIDAHVWLGQKVTVMKNVTVGKGTMVGYGSIVTKSLPENCIAAGSPARVIKRGILWKR